MTNTLTERLSKEGFSERESGSEIYKSMVKSVGHLEVVVSGSDSSYDLSVIDTDFTDDYATIVVVTDTNENNVGDAAIHLLTTLEVIYEYTKEQEEAFTKLERLGWELLVVSEAGFSYWRRGEQTLAYNEIGDIIEIVDQIFDDVYKFDTTKLIFTGKLI